MAAPLFAALALIYAPSAQANIDHPPTATEAVETNSKTQRLVGLARHQSQPTSTTYGPFRILDEGRAALVAATDERSPAAFRRMLAENPNLAVLVMLDCPGTYDDTANLQLGRMIRRARMETYVPRNGSVRSGAVELFLAGVERKVERGAEFAVHSWLDDHNRQAADYAITAPENRKYLSYYEEMGMAPGLAQRFYAMTNSVPHDSALWLDSRDMRQWLDSSGWIGGAVKAQTVAQSRLPKIAYLDLAAALN